MKYAYYIILFIFPLFINCKKKQDAIPPEIKGVNFDLLLKTVDIYPDSKSVTTYTYNNSKQLIQEKSVRNFTDGTIWTVTNNWYRSSGERIDSMKSEFTYGNDATGLQKQYYYYTPSGTLAYAILYRNANNPFGSVDSCIFIYSGDLIVKRMDYTSANSTILDHELTHEMFYEYDSSKNISSIAFVNYDFSGGFPPKKDTVTLSYSYDTQKNPYYQTEAFYAYFVNLAFENYSSKNNIIKILYRGNTSSNDRDEFSFQYNAGNKPDRALVTSYGIGSNQPAIWTTDYYYD
jgi:hypothetical protein